MECLTLESRTRMLQICLSACHTHHTKRKNKKRTKWNFQFTNMPCPCLLYNRSDHEHAYLPANNVYSIRFGHEPPSIVEVLEAQDPTCFVGPDSSSISPVFSVNNFFTWRFYFIFQLIYKAKERRFCYVEIAIHY